MYAKLKTLAQTSCESDIASAVCSRSARAGLFIRTSRKISRDVACGSCNVCRFVTAEEMVAPWQGARFDFEINLDDSDDDDDDDMSDDFE